MNRLSLGAGPTPQPSPYGQQMLLYRERLLSLLLTLMGFFLSVLFGLYLWRFWDYPVLRWIYLGLLTASFFLGWGRALIPLPYMVRVGFLLGLIYIIAVYAALFYGDLSEANLFFLLGVLLGTVFLSGRWMVFNLLFATALHFLTSYFVLDQGETLARLAGVPEAVLLGSGQWVYTSGAFVITGLGVAGILYFIRKRFETTLEDTIQLTRILEHERQRLSDREQTLRRRVRQIRAASEIVNALGHIADPKEMMNHVVEQIQQHFGLYYVGIFLVDESFEFAVLQAGSGEPGKRMVAEGYRLPLGGTSMIAWAITHREPRVALNVYQDPAHYENPYLPYTRSELALPLIARGEVLGAMTIQSDRVNAFDDEDLRTFQALANSVALALSNVLLVERLQNQLREVEALQQRLLGQAWGEWARELLVRREGPQVGPSILHPADDHEPSTLIMPIRLYGQKIGEVRVVSARPWQEGEPELLEGIVALLTNHLMVARLLDEVQQYAYREEVQNKLTTRFASALDFELLARAALEGLSETFQLQEAWLILDVSAADADGDEPDHAAADRSPHPGGEAA